MHRIARTRPLPALLLALVAAVAVLYETVGARSGSRQAPTTTATVSLGRVLDGLEQRAGAVMKLTAMADEVKVEKERREGEIKALRDKLAATADEGERLLVEEELALKSLNYQAWARFKTDQQDVETALLLQELYRSIKLAVAEMAETEGYDLVVVDDSQGELSWTTEARVSREAQVLQQIRGRRLLYATGAVDITDDLVARMNNKFRMGGN
jgi:Skp family chaperone for outer membrane proteins